MSCAFYLEQLEQAPAQHPQATSLLRQIYAQLTAYDETGDARHLGGLESIEVGHRLLYAAGAVTAENVESFMALPDMHAFIMRFDPRTEAAQRVCRMEWLAEEYTSDAEHVLTRQEAMYQAPLYFFQYVANILATCAASRALQVKACLRLAVLAKDPVTWEACTPGMQMAMAVAGAMANPKSSFRDEFLRMGGMTGVALGYMEGDQEKERSIIYENVLQRITSEELERMPPAEVEGLLRALPGQVFDLEATSDYMRLSFEVFAKIFDTRVFQRNVGKWQRSCWFYKDMRSPFLLFVATQVPRVRRQFPWMTRHNVGLLLARMWMQRGHLGLRQAYGWAIFSERRRKCYRAVSTEPERIEAAMAAQERLGKEELGWEDVLIEHAIEDEAKCAVCGTTQGRLTRCGRCKWRVYCSRTCQKVDWTGRGHKERCIASSEE